MNEISILIEIAIAGFILAVCCGGFYRLGQQGVFSKKDKLEFNRLVGLKLQGEISNDELAALEIMYKHTRHGKKGRSVNDILYDYKRSVTLSIMEDLFAAEDCLLRKKRKKEEG